jgi:hypothetical protein
LVGGGASGAILMVIAGVVEEYDGHQVNRLISQMLSSMGRGFVDIPLPGLRVPAKARPVRAGRQLE